MKAVRPVGAVVVEGSGESSAPKVGLEQIRAAQIHALQVRPLEVSTLQVGAKEVGSRQRHAAEVCVLAAILGDQIGCLQKSSRQ
jgi:hypothetical protein